MKDYLNQTIRYALAVDMKPAVGTVTAYSEDGTIMQIGDVRVPCREVHLLEILADGQKPSGSEEVGDLGSGTALPAHSPTPPLPQSPQPPAAEPETKGQESGVRSQESRAARKVPPLRTTNH